MQPFILLAVLAFALLSSGCQNNAGPYETRQLNDSTSVSGLTGDSVKLVKTAGINFKVADVEESLKALSGLSKKHGGAVYEQNFSAEETDRRELKLSNDSLLVISTVTPRAGVTVRIPSENLEAFLFDAADLGYYTGSSRLKVDDKSLAYLENALRQKARKDVLSAPASANRRAPAALQTVQMEDEAIGRFIANKTIDADAAYSTASLALFQNAVVRKETVANYAVADYGLPFGRRLGNALNAGWEGFLNFLLAVLHLWIFILLGIAGYLVYRYLQGRRKLA